MATVTIAIDTPAELVLTGGAPTIAPAVRLELGAMEARLVAQAQLDSFTPALPNSAVSAHNPIMVGFLISGTLQTAQPLADVTHIGHAAPRLVEMVIVSHTAPVIVNGQPVLPKYKGSFPTGAALVFGPNDIHAIPNPDPVWNPATSGWFVQPPPSGVGDARWTVQTLPDPAGFPGQYYWLGDPSAADGTSGIAAACRQWAPDASTPGAPSWRSIYPYKPSVRAHVNFGAGGNILTVTKGVRFNPVFIEHMWMDWGTDVLDGFTWVIVGIVMDFPNAGYEHTLLDVGGSPASFGAPGLTENDLGPEHGLSDLGINAPYRVQMSLNVNQQKQQSDLAGTAQILSPFNYVTRPKMWFGGWGNASSFSGSYSTAGKYLQKASLPPTLQRNVVLGRRGGILSRQWASHLVVFEMRAWKHLLSASDLNEQYAQLSSTWQFGAYS